ncbi:MAG: TraB/GumN family protein [Clostridiales bacterium]|jgi:uncharacterized protein YbaP (TraB family)|nr:TraB/GumN family protein [Clostridiales bacterium]
MKKIFAILLAVLVMATNVFAFEQTQMIDGAEFVPVRVTADLLGWEVEWDSGNKMVLLTDPNGNGFIVLESAGQNIDGRIFIPIELAESIFNAEVPVAEAETSAIAEAPRPTTPIPANATGRNIHGMITRVSHGENVAYIIGSMHTGQPDWFPLHPVVEDAMARADVFAFEVDMNEVENLSDETLERIIEIQTLPDGLTLQDILPRDIYENFVENFKTYSVLGITYDIVADLKPITIILLMDTIMEPFLDTESELSVDGYVADFAREHDKPIVGLNEVLRELEIIYDMPLETQALMLADFPNFRTMLNSYTDSWLPEAYATQNIAEIAEVLIAADAMAEDDPVSEMYNNNLMYVRDNIFAEEIARLLVETEEPTTFFVTIGLAHIIDGYGIVIDLLDEMGFEIISLWVDL